MVRCSMATNLAPANNNGQIMIGMGKGELIEEARAARAGIGGERGREQKDGTQASEEDGEHKLDVVATMLKTRAGITVSALKRGFSPDKIGYLKWR